LIDEDRSRIERVTVVTVTEFTGVFLIPFSFFKKIILSRDGQTHRRSSLRRPSLSAFLGVFGFSKDTTLDHLYNG
jgi:hypothetical protein